MHKARAGGENGPIACQPDDKRKRQKGRKEAQKLEKREEDRSGQKGVTKKGQRKRCSPPPTTMIKCPCA